MNNLNSTSLRCIDAKYLGALKTSKLLRLLKNVTIDSLSLNLFTLKQRGNPTKIVLIGPYLVTPSKPPPNNFFVGTRRHFFSVARSAESARVACRYISIRAILLFTRLTLYVQDALHVTLKSTGTQNEIPRVGTKAHRSQRVHNPGIFSLRKVA